MNLGCGNDDTNSHLHSPMRSILASSSRMRSTVNLSASCLRMPTRQAASTSKLYASIKHLPARALTSNKPYPAVKMSFTNERHLLRWNTPSSPLQWSSFRNNHPNARIILTSCVRISYYEVTPVDYLANDACRFIILRQNGCRWNALFH